MSYRNPPIIVDRSTEVWGQAIAGLGQQIAQGITSVGEARRKAEKAQREAAEKQRAAMQKLEVKVRESYMDSARDNYIALKNNADVSIANQFKADVGKLLNGEGVPGEEGYKMGAIDARVQLELNTNLTDEQRKEYTKIVDESKLFQSQAVDGFGKVISSVQDISEKDPNKLGTAGGFVFNGKTTKERFENQLAYYAVNPDIMIDPSVKETRKTSRGEKGENYLETSTLVPVDQFKEGGSFAGTLSSSDIEGLKKVTEDGKDYYKFEFKRDVNVWDGNFTTDIPERPDYSSIYGEANIEDEKGTINAKLIGKVQTQRGNYIDSEEIVDVNTIKNDPSLNNILNGQAARINRAPDAEVEAFLNFGTDRGGLTIQELNKQYPTFSQRQEYIKNILVDNSIETKFSQYAQREATTEDVARLKESDPNSIVSEGDTIYYKVLKSEKIKEEKPTVSEIKSKKQEDKLRKRAEDRLSAIKGGAKTAIRAALGEVEVAQEGTIVRLYPDTDDEQKYDMNRKEDIARLAKDLEVSEFGSDQQTDDVLILIDEILERKRKERLEKEKNKLP